MRTSYFPNRTRVKQQKQDYCDYYSSRSASANSRKWDELLTKCQDEICEFFLQNVKENSPLLVLKEFESLFIKQSGCQNQKVAQALHEIIYLDQAEVFALTLKRTCYILINNWCLKRNHEEIQQLVELFAEVTKPTVTVSLIKKRFGRWLNKFVSSQDYQDLKRFASQYDCQEQNHWSDRYASYFLVAQSVDGKKPIEQREAARLLSQQLKERFKFDLAMYTAHANSEVSLKNQRINPTVLGESVLRLIQKILLKQGKFSYRNLANIFLKQTEGLRYEDFKYSLAKYLFFGSGKNEQLNKLQQNMSDYLNQLYTDYNEKIVTSDLILRNCKQLISHLTTQKRGKPSHTFIILEAETKYLILAIILLKLVLICRPVYTHLEASLGWLMQYYEARPDCECESLINFLETLRITLTIYAENINYNLVNMEEEKSQTKIIEKLKEKRIFSQVKLDHPLSDPLKTF